MIYKAVPRGEIIDALAHIYDLHRRVKPSHEREFLAYERREAAARELMSNLPRTNEHPTLKTLLEVADIYSLTLEGAHKLFGYNLGGMREYDLKLNGDRTHIERSHKSLRSREIHRSLGVGDASERECDEGWSQNMQDTHPSLG